MRDEDLEEVAESVESIAPRVLGIIVATVVVLCGVGWIAEGSEFFLAKVFAPKEEAVRRETFEQSKAYQEGVAQDLEQLRIEYARARSADERQAIAAAARHKASGYTGSLPADVQAFVDQVRGAP